MCLHCALSRTCSTTLREAVKQHEVTSTKQGRMVYWSRTVVGECHVSAFRIYSAWKVVPHLCQSQARLWQTFCVLPSLRSQIMGSANTQVMVRQMIHIMHELTTAKLRSIETLCH